jgi:hypothetical protein
MERQRRGSGVSITTNLEQLDKIRRVIDLEPEKDSEGEFDDS